jgi:hypothetical protein
MSKGLSLPQMEGIASQIIAIETGGFEQATAKLLMSMFRMEPARHPAAA